ncbi:MAG: hypothetical protein ACYC8T_29560 [Myxococcaceae bacterium]
MPSTLPPSLAPKKDDKGGVVSKVSTFLGFFRWAFMPLGLFALVAVGVHAAADTVDDRILWLVDNLDSLFDTLFAAWSVTEPLVNLVSTTHRTLIARAITLAWELGADLVIALPALGYREEDAPAQMKRISFLTRPRTFSALFKRVYAQPTSARLVRPLAAAALVLAGACSIAGMVQGALYLSLRQGIAGDEFAGPFARLAAIGALALVLGTFGWRVVLRSLQSADKLSEEASKTRLRPYWAGLVGTGLLAPLALAGLLDASPILSFFR